MRWIVTSSVLAITCYAPVFAMGAHAIDPHVYRCLQQASVKHRIPLPLLLSIAEVESQFNPKAVGRAGRGTDYGLLQINSYWLPKLATFGISTTHLFNPCINADVGAWILSQNIASMGYNWGAVGAYNAVSKDKRIIYASRVSAKLPKYTGQSMVLQRSTAGQAWQLQPVQTGTDTVTGMLVWESQP